MPVNRYISVEKTEEEITISFQGEGPKRNWADTDDAIKEIESAVERIDRNVTINLSGIVAQASIMIAHLLLLKKDVESSGYTFSMKNIEDVLREQYKKTRLLAYLTEQQDDDVLFATSSAGKVD